MRKAREKKNITYTSFEQWEDLNFSSTDLDIQKDPAAVSKQVTKELHSLVQKKTEDESTKK